MDQRFQCLGQRCVVCGVHVDGVLVAGARHGGGIKECTARLLCHTLHLCRKTFGDLDGLRLEAAEGAVRHIRPIWMGETTSTFGAE